MPPLNPPKTPNYQQPYDVVQSQVDAMNERADRALQTANDTIDQLTQVKAFEQGTPPRYDLNAELPPNTPTDSASAPASDLFGEVAEYQSLDDPGDGDVLAGIDFSELDLPDFDASIGQLAIPEPPSPIDTGGAPRAPTQDAIDIPREPDFAVPALGRLRDIEIPEFEFPELPSFDAAAPVFEAAAPSGEIAYREPEYKSQSLDAITAEVTRLMAGGTGIPVAVEGAIFARDKQRADAQGRAATQQAFDTWAARGFDMPPGMLAAEVDAAREGSREQVAQASREVMIQAAQFEIENLRFAVTQGLAVEQLLSNLFDNAAARALDMAKSRRDADVAIYNAQVSLYNARQQGYSVQAQVYGQKLRAALSKLEVYRARIEGQQAIGAANEQVVRAYQAKVEAVRGHAEIYATRMRGAETQASVQRQRIEGYRAEIDAYSARLEADGKRYDAYQARMSGEKTKADILASEARAFAATVDAQQGKANLKAEQVRAQVAVLEAKTQRYSARSAAERDKVAASASAIQARAGAYSAAIGRYSAELDAQTSRDSLQARIIQDKLRNNIALYQAQMREYDAAQQRLLQNTQVQVQGISAAGRMASQLAAGAMSAMSVGANLSGSSSYSNSYSTSQTYYHDTTGEFST